MKKNIYILCLLILLTVTTSCENEHVVDVNIVHEEFTVVQSELKTDKLFPGVRFTKTLPLGVPYDIKQAELINITAYIRIDSIQIIPLIYDQDGLYKSLYEFRVEPGRIYELFAERDGTFIYSQTVIPEKPIVTSAIYSSNENYLQAVVVSRNNEVYAALWAISSAPFIKADDYFSVSVPTDITPVSTINVRTSSIPEEFQSPAYNNSRFIQVFSFDKSFKNYFNSRTSGEGISDPFVQGGSAIEWNVYGDNVIGMFIGVAEGELVPVF
jgi:hypothetical protein